MRLKIPSNSVEVHNMEVGISGTEVLSLKDLTAESAKVVLDLGIFVEVVKVLLSDLFFQARENDTWVFDYFVFFIFSNIY